MKTWGLSEISAPAAGGSREAHLIAGRAGKKHYPRLPMGVRQSADKKGASITATL